jgi:TetR/AcrR family transcriptional regulator, transcriptional repressor for nem operon
MKKGELTRRRIVERSAPVFNTKGYAGASMSDLVVVTGLEKGGIYNHFGSKEELALEAFDYATGIVRERLREALEAEEGALNRLFAVVEVLGTVAEDPPVPGGCPVLNTAVEADDAYPALKERAAGAIDDWLRLVGREVKEGVKGGGLSPRVDPRAVASVVVATLEGAVILSRLHDDPAHMRRAVEHLKNYLRSLGREGA